MILWLHAREAVPFFMIPCGKYIYMPLLNTSWLSSIPSHISQLEHWCGPDLDCKEMERLFIWPAWCSLHKPYLRNAPILADLCSILGVTGGSFCPQQLLQHHYPFLKIMSELTEIEVGYNSEMEMGECDTILLQQKYMSEWTSLVAPHYKTPRRVRSSQFCYIRTTSLDDLSFRAQIHH